MVQPRKVPRGEELAELVERFTTDQRIADHLATKGIKVSRSAVSMARAESRVETARRPRYVRYIPWSVREAHNHLYAVAMLRYFSRRDEGKLLRPKDEAALDRWLAHLDKDGVRITYDRDQGFYAVPADAPELYEYDGPIAVIRDAG